MPLNVRRFSTLFFIAVFGTASNAIAQTPPPAATPSPGASPASTPAPNPPTVGELMLERISRAKAFVAVRNYAAAVYELETIKRESGDASVNSVAIVLLMNCYLEQGSYKRAQTLLNELFRSYKANNAHSAIYYPAAAGQVVKSARLQLERYRGLGLAVSSRSLPLEAINDIEQMRETIEIVISQAKEMVAEPVRSAVGMPMLEEATAVRSGLARDDYDARRWRDEISDTRERIASSQSVIKNAVVEIADAGKEAIEKPVPAVKDAAGAVESALRAETHASQAKPTETALAATENPVVADNRTAGGERAAGDARPVIVVGNAPKREEPPPSEPARKGEDPGSTAANDTGSAPLELGSLIAYATRQQAPIYPATARQMRTTGIVRVDVIVDENGDVSDVTRSAGPTLLQNAAREAVRKWKFRPFMREGRPVRVAGFVNFNFTL